MEQVSLSKLLNQNWQQSKCKWHNEVNKLYMLLHLKQFQHHMNRYQRHICLFTRYNGQHIGCKLQRWLSHGCSFYNWKGMGCSLVRLDRRMIGRDRLYYNIFHQLRGNMCFNLSIVCKQLWERLCLKRKQNNIKGCRLGICWFRLGHIILQCRMLPRHSKDLKMQVGLQILWSIICIELHCHIVCSLLDMGHRLLCRNWQSNH